MEGDSEAVRVAILPAPGMGHLIPLGELAKLLVTHHSISVTFITFAESASKAQKAFLDALPSTITSLQLPPVSLTDLPSDTHVETRMSIATDRSLPAVRNILRNLQQSTRLIAFIVDLFATDTFTVSKELGIPSFLFYTSNLFSLSLILHLPELDASTTCEYRDLPEPLQLPGCVPVLGSDLLHPLRDRSNDSYKWMVHHGKRYRDADAILVNTFKDIEPETAKIINEEDNKLPPVYLIGPLIQSCSPDIELANCLSWLDKQPKESVLYVSFGSGGTLTCAQMKELACGLEMSGQRFLWVVRSPSDTECDANYFDSTSVDDPVAFLPEGFVERTKEVGLLVPSWAPQLQVLAHRATGGFLSHCGWNSTLESVMHGVPMIAWPLYAEQRMNAVMLTEGVKVALRPGAAADGIYKSEEIAKVVKALMEGEEGKEVREKTKELQEGGTRALMEDGESCKVITELTNRLRSTIT
ncbi:hydroquinone glucosyltransferase-like [Dioscorea cayenensis subsp. rotundata]|uniref:Glycosyltransferase n=1 Tax=Dioscorea cayennensis subsp. rotundata TaxID=55577 RepID=A0AB40B7K9_DIOCR|nr:hydroquinone glucosyltransferase-like [Dioscorea cayenensis subsp. rotundata]